MRLRCAQGDPLGQAGLDGRQGMPIFLQSDRFNSILGPEATNLGAPQLGSFLAAARWVLLKAYRGGEFVMNGGITQPGAGTRCFLPNMTLISRNMTLVARVDRPLLRSCIRIFVADSVDRPRRRRGGMYPFTRKLYRNARKSSFFHLSDEKIADKLLGCSINRACSLYHGRITIDFRGFSCAKCHKYAASS